MESNSPPSFFQKYALLLFFGLAFLISWVFWFIEPSLRTRDSISATFFIQLGSYGPILAAMLVSTLSTPERTRPPIWPRLLAAWLALAAAVFANWSLGKYIFTGRVQPAQAALFVLLTLLPAWIFFNARSSVKGLQDLLNSLTRWRINPLWFVVALFLMLVLSAAGMWLTSLITGRPLSAWLTSIRGNPILDNIALTFFATLLYGGPLGEEAGWRGFALPRLQKRFDLLLASVYLGLIWGLWHLPLHVTGYYNEAFGNPLTGLLLRAFTTIPLALIFTWLYNRTSGNLLVIVFLHTAVNVTSGLIFPEVGSYIVITIAVVLMVVFDRMYKMPDKAPEIRA